MFDEEVDRYETYEEYLDSLVSEEDHLYLEDEEMARIIAELGYRWEFMGLKNLSSIHGKSEERIKTSVALV